MASAAAVASSSREAFAIGNPVKSDTIVYQLKKNYYYTNRQTNAYT
jgi:hypothetical protein